MLLMFWEVPYIKGAVLWCEEKDTWVTHGAHVPLSDVQSRPTVALMLQWVH